MTLWSALQEPTTLAPAQLPMPQKTAELALTLHTDPLTLEDYVREYFKDTPIMADIARCESRFRQLDAKGEIFRGEVNPADVGVMQINEYYHLKTAEKMGIDIYTVGGNLAYAKYLYEKEGTQPWISSSPCWKKFTGNAVAVKKK